MILCHLPELRGVRKRLRSSIAKAKFLRLPDLALNIYFPPKIDFATPMTRQTTLFVREFAKSKAS